MRDSSNPGAPKTQHAAAGGPPEPPKKTARGLGDQSPEEPHIDIPDPVAVGVLASALRLKPFEIIADLIEVGKFANARGTVCFETAAKVAWKHGFYVRRVA
jgi:hypothetical protein